MMPTTKDRGWYPQEPFQVVNPRWGGDTAGWTADVILPNSGIRFKVMHMPSAPKAGSFPAGSLAGVAGNSGNAKNTPPHHHTEVYVKNKKGQWERRLDIDPSPWF